MRVGSDVVDTAVCPITNDYSRGAQSCCAGAFKNTGSAKELPFGCYYKTEKGQTTEDRLWFNPYGAAHRSPAVPVQAVLICGLC